MRKFSVAVLGAISFNLRCVLATTSSTAAIELSTSGQYFNPDNISDYARSLIYEENTNYDPCLCDLTS